MIVWLDFCVYRVRAMYMSKLKVFGKVERGLPSWRNSWRGLQLDRA